MKKNLEQLSPFELSLYLEDLHNSEQASKEWLNAGRGNPNWTAPIPREAYFLLGQFATQETYIHGRDRLGSKSMNTIGRDKRFDEFLKPKESLGATLLRKIWNASADVLGMPASEWLTYMLDYLIGDNYPHQERVLPGCEHPIKQYLQQKLFDDRSAPFDIFAVEGGTAGIVYTFNSFISNHLLEPGDKIAMMTPTFAPYLEIPDLPEYQFDVKYVRSKSMDYDGKVSYQFPKEELDKLRSPDIKAVFVVNPSNPTATAINDESITQLKAIIEEDNPELMIISDDVYGTFLKKFHSLFTEIPYNTVCIYSYSKYFGATGWRIGTISVAKDNIFDKKLQELNGPVDEKIDSRYHIIDSTPKNIRFIDRMVADSRLVALNHTAGLSAPQQAMMTIFSLYALLDEGDNFKNDVMSLCRKRGNLLYESLGLTYPLESLNTAYYCEINFDWWLTKRFGEEFRDYIIDTFTMTEIVSRLAQEERVNLLKAEAFGSSEWTVRISLANLDTPKYAEIGLRITQLMTRLFQEWYGNQFA